jgi:hypothetical protein
LIWSQECNTREEALTAEMQIKNGAVRKKKHWYAAIGKPFQPMPKRISEMTASDNQKMARYIFWSRYRDQKMLATNGLQRATLQAIHGESCSNIYQSVRPE